MSGHAVAPSVSIVAGAVCVKARQQRAAPAARTGLSSVNRPLASLVSLSARSRRCRRLRVCAAADEENLFEPERTKKAREKRQAKVKVTAPLVDKINRGSVTDQDKAEAQYISYLALLFILILIEGIAVGASGFLSEEGDKFVLTYIFPAFTPSIGFFLLCSSAYGVWKAGLLGNKGDSDQPQ